MRRLISHWVAGFAIAIGCAGGVGASDLYLLPGTLRMVRRFIRRVARSGYEDDFSGRDAPGIQITKSVGAIAELTGFDPGEIAERSAMELV